MYSVNGIALDNTSMGWRLRGPSEPLSQLLRRVEALRIPGRDGVVPLPSTMDAPTIMLMVKTPLDKLEALYALFLQPDTYLSLTATPSRRVTFEYLSAKIVDYGPKVELCDVTFAVRLSGAYWRDTSETITASVAIGNPVETVDVFAGISAPIHDAMVFVGGAFGGVEVRDSGGSWFATTKIWSSSTRGILFNAATGQAFSSDVSNPWVPLVDATDGVDFSGGPGFRLTPYLVNGDPSSRVARVQLTTETQNNVTFRVKGRGAYVV